MKMTGQPCTLIDWTCLPEALVPGAEGTARGRVAEFDGVRVRQVRYSPGYRADHWCEKGHVLLVLEGELTVEFQDRGSMVLRVGDGCHLADELLPHRAVTAGGAVVLIVD